MNREPKRQLLMVRLALREGRVSVARLLYVSRLQDNFKRTKGDYTPSEQRIISDPRSAEALAFIDADTYRRMVRAADSAQCAYRLFREDAERAAADIVRQVGELRKSLRTFFSSTPAGLEQHKFTVRALAIPHIPFEDAEAAGLFGDDVPSLDDLLAALAQEAHAFKFSEMPVPSHIPAALRARKNQKTQFLRGFLATLGDYEVYMDDLPTRKAAAIIAAVACGEDITPDDVTKASNSMK